MDGLSRRDFLGAAAAGAAGAAVLWPASVRAQGALGPAARVVPLNADWRFGGQLVPGALEPGFDDSGFARVTLPHCVTTLSWYRWDNLTWDGDWIYRRHFDRPADTAGLRVFVDFAGAMTTTMPAINGVALPERAGGYLPFSYELTDHLAERGNVLAVALNADARPNVPPQSSRGGARGADYLQPGGIYREVSLRALPPVFIADVFAKPVDVLDPGRRVDVRCTVDAAEPVRGSVRVALRRNGSVIREASEPVEIAAPGPATVDLRLERLGDVAL